MITYFIVLPLLVVMLVSVASALRTLNKMRDIVDDSNVYPLVPEKVHDMCEIGAGALAGLTTGEQNVAIGGQAIYMPPVELPNEPTD